MTTSHKIRFLAVLLACLCALQIFPVFAQEETYTTVSEQYTLNSQAVYAQAAPTGNVTGKYKDQLTQEQKELYDRFLTLTPANPELEFKPEELQNVALPANFATDNRVKEAFHNEIGKKLSAIVVPVYLAVTMDNPMLFWCSGVTYGFGYRYNATQITELNATFGAQVGKGVTAASYEGNLANLQRVLDGLHFDTNATRYDLLKEMHDFVASKTVYDLNAPYAHSLYGALVDGKSVCEGYAYAFKLLCDRYNIPCMIVTGVGKTNTGSEAHAWNVVQMPDGKWYGVDVTWDDQESKIYDDFFLVGSQTVPKSFQKIPFGESHRAEVIEMGGVSYPLTVPKLAEQVYVQPAVTTSSYDINGDSSVDSFDIVYLLQCLAGTKQPVGNPDPDGRDGKLTSNDGTVLLQYLAGIR